MFFPWYLTLSLTVLICSLNIGCATTLATDEVEALKQIAETLGKDWDFSVDPCSGELSWFTPTDDKRMDLVNQVNCSCSFNNNTCHVTRIILKRQNLGGKVPPELFRLPYLIEIDLTRNYLNGTIPREWGTMQQLVNISLLGNRVTGGLPIELANISSLLNLVLDNNQLSGNIPPQFGDFSKLERLSLISNNLTGELPQSLAKLTTMKDFRISDNNFSGNIPDFIERWTSLRRLEIQGSGLSGPIPSGIASMANLSELRISDLKGNYESTFPLLRKDSNFKKIILRSCNIIGQLPKDFGKTSDLEILDFSFNKLSGPIPATFSSLPYVVHVYLTGNLLTGQLPARMLTAGNPMDLSYNNLTMPESIGSKCQHGKLNLFASSKGNTTGIVSCLRSRSNCNQTYYSLHINCGGREVKDERTTYEKDIDPGGPSNFFESGKNWGFSSTGRFQDNNNQNPDYSRTTNATNANISGKNPQLYMDARVSPLSLSYYGFCLRNGNYTISLHFAEIVFTEDKTYTSLGRRMFDVYIQGQRELKDFNIEYEAGGVNIGIVRNFSAVVTDNTLDIRFYWAGRGTTGIPNLGDYGPLISAISVNPDFPVPSGNGNSISVGSIIGIVIAVLFTVLLVLSIFWWKGYLRPKDTLEQDLKGLGQHTGLFTLRQIRAATNNFDPANKIGEGGFGPVYKGRLQSNGTIIAVKQLSSKSKQGNREFVNEIGMISALQHPHLVKLYGCCIEGNQLLLVYEYMENNSLARALFSQEKYQLKLDWTTRHKICIGIARGLAYLHEESRLKIVHRDIKATNVLLDKNLNPKISDFGLAKLDEEDNTHISTRIAGTLGYMAPEYAMRGYLTDKADVYSFGVVLLEIVSGRSNTSIKTKDDNFYLLDWANSLKAEGKLMELVDPSLGLNFNEEEVIITINLALCCSNAVATERPSMSAAVSILEGRAHVGEFVSDSSVSIYKMKPMEITSQDHVTNSSISVDNTWPSSSKSASDLYPITLDTDNWKD